MLKQISLFIALITCTICVAAQSARRKGRMLSKPVWLSGTVCFQDSTNYPYEVILKADGIIVANHSFNKGDFLIKSTVTPTSVSVNALGHKRHSCISPWQYNHVIQRS